MWIGWQTNTYTMQRKGSWVFVRLKVGWKQFGARLFNIIELLLANLCARRTEVSRLYFRDIYYIEQREYRVFRL